MPRITKEMLEDQLKHHYEVCRKQASRIELLEKEVFLLKSPATIPGQITVQLITIQRLSEALAQVISELKKRP